MENYKELELISQRNSLAAFADLIGMALVRTTNTFGKRRLVVLRRGTPKDCMCFSLDKLISLYNRGRDSKYYKDLKLCSGSFLCMVVGELPRKPITAKRKDFERL